MDESKFGEAKNSEGKYSKAVELLEKFDRGGVDMPEILAALKNGQPNELQLESALGEVKLLLDHVRGVTQPWRKLENEDELASHQSELEEAKKTLYEALISINPGRKVE